MGDPPVGKIAGDGAAVRPALAVAIIASAVAGIVHLAAAVNHDGGAVLFRLFLLAAGAQIAWAAVAALRPGRRVLALGAALNAGAVLVWALTHTTGISMVGSLADAQAVGTPDLGAALFATTSVLSSLWLLARPRSTGVMRMNWVSLVAAAALVSALPSLAADHEHEPSGDEVRTELAATSGVDGTDHAHEGSAGSDEGHDHAADGDPSDSHGDVHDQSAGVHEDSHGADDHGTAVLAGHVSHEDASHDDTSHDHSTDPTDPTDSHDHSTDPTDPTDSHDHSTDPTDPTDSHEHPTDPADPTDPHEHPTDPTDPTDPSDSTDPTDPHEHPDDPTEPTGPITSIDDPRLTEEQWNIAVDLIVTTTAGMRDFVTEEDVVAGGYQSIGDGGQPGQYTHYVNWSYLSDEYELDAAHIESIVMKMNADGSLRVVSAMYILTIGKTMEDAPVLAGELTTWHDHDNLCFSGTSLVGLAVDGVCEVGVLINTPPMLHVWVEANPCGPFAGIDEHGLDCGETHLH